jgi:ribosomal protein S18 acetylase RimI-like enzyme
MKRNQDIIRKASVADIPRLMDLLHQVNMVHHHLRPELFKPNTTKYSEQELETLLGDELKPIFVYDEGEVLGYAFCQITEVKNDRLLQDRKSLYIDDLCVDETARGRHIGSALFEFVRDYAKSIGCHAVTLNVWAGNDAAMQFYQSKGMQPQKTGMEMELNRKK